MATRPTSEPVVLRCVGLVKRYGTVLAVDGLDLEVCRGECFGLLGPNGAGKTTTIEILEGLLAPAAGAVEVLGSTWGHDDQALRERLGIQLQETQLNDKLTVEETLRLFRSFHSVGRAVPELLALVQLDTKRTARVAHLSGGQRQRLSVACALVGAPDVLFLDEPSTGLDPQSRRQLWDVLQGFRATVGTVLMTTHSMDEAAAVCTRVAIVDRGKLIALGTPAELVAALGAEHVVEFALHQGDVMPTEAALKMLPGVRDVRREGERMALSVSHMHETVPALLAALDGRRDRLSLLNTHSATLEDVFVSLTGRHLRDD